MIRSVFCSIKVDRAGPFFAINVGLNKSAKLFYRD